MNLYLTLSRGPRADLAEPILASSDPQVIQAVLFAIGSMADDSLPVPESKVRVLIPEADRHDSAR